MNISVDNRGSGIAEGGIEVEIKWNGKRIIQEAT